MLNINSTNRNILSYNCFDIYQNNRKGVYILGFYSNNTMVKRFLACSGGGDKGIIMVGMLLQMLKIKGKDCVDWDELAGISVGGFLVAYISQTTKDTFEPMMLTLKDAFLQNKIQVIETWSWGGQFLNFINAFLYHTSLYSNHTIKKTVQKWFHPDNVIRPFHVGAFNKTLACYETFSSMDTSNDMVKALLASSAVPVILPEVIGLSFVLKTFLSKFLSTISLTIQPALRIKTDPKKNNNICFKYKIVFVSK